MDRTQRQGPLTRLPQHPRAVRSARPPFSFVSVLEVAAKHRPSPSGGSILNCSYSGSALERWSDDTDAHEGLGELSGMPLMWHVPGYFDVTLCHAEPRQLCEFVSCQTKSRQTWLTFESDSSEENSGEMQHALSTTSPLWKPDPQMAFRFTTNTNFCSISYFFKLFFSSQREKQEDQKRISDRYFCAATEFKVLWKYYLHVEVFFLFLVTYITTEGMWAFWH